MPWNVFQVDSEHCVFQIDDDGGRVGDTLGCHITEAKATAQVKALYANVEEVAMLGNIRPTWTIEVDNNQVTIGELVEAWQKSQAGEVTPIGEIDGSLRDIASSIEDAFNLAFAPDTAWREEKAPRYYIKDVFKDHPRLGDALTVDDRQEGYTFAVDYEDSDAGLVFASRQDWQQVQLTYAMAESGRVEAMELSESASGRVVALVESEPVAPSENRSPLSLDVVLIEPGPGNKRNNHYYPAEMLRRDANVFVGAKMYNVDHVETDRSERTEVSKIKEIIGFTDDGAPIARVVVFDPAFAEKTRNRAAADELNSLECSILASGTAKPGEIGGTKYKIVESITEAHSVDWVTRAGAGGHAHKLAESEVSMSEQLTKPTETDEVQEVEKTAIETAAETVTIAEAQEEVSKDTPEPTPLDAPQVAEALAKTNLPSASQERLSASTYADAAVLAEAIEAEISYVKEITGSGKPFAQGASAAPEAEQISESDKTERFNQIMRQVGAREV